MSKPLSFNFTPDAEKRAERLDAHSKCCISTLLLRLYSVKKLRSFVISLCNRLEGGAFFSETIRLILKQYHGVNV